MGFALLQILVAAQLFTVGHNADQVRLGSCEGQAGQLREQAGWG